MSMYIAVTRLQVLGVCVCVCVCVKMQVGNKEKHTACASKHFVSISKMSKVREAVTVLTTE